MSEADVLALRRRCGVLFQHGALFSSLTVAENVAVPLREHTELSKKFIEELAILKVAFTGFPMASVTKYPNELSGGMRRRAALARAIALDPELLFLDEPTSGLDPISAAGFDELVQHLREWLRLTIVIITHDLDSLWRIADRVAVLGNGKVLGIGTMDELSRSTDPLIHEYFHGPRGRAAREQAWNPK
jgi:phospholipid/cholesterol/gamma-HCH transport system ATP-binding protein